MKKLLNYFKSPKKYKNYFLKDNLKKEIDLGLASIGKWSYGSPKIFRWDWKSKLIIGNFCSLGPDIKIYFGGEHRLDWITTSQLPSTQFSDVFSKAKDIQDFSISKGDINIGHDVWIGGGATILSGVSIGTGAVIAAGSVVVNNVEPFSISGGNPNKEIKKRFDNKIINRILDSEWWNLPDENINELSLLLCSNDTTSFFEQIKKFKKSGI
jgi:acetyltransferase-like isoleucine patch superfamily enzyme